MGEGGGGGLIVFPIPKSWGALRNDIHGYFYCNKNPLSPPFMNYLKSVNE